MPSKSKKVTIRFSKKMKIEMQKAVIDSDYGLHGKSKWLAAAIKKLTLNPYLISLVGNGTSESQAELTEVEAFYLSNETLEDIKFVIIKVREQDPFFEGIQSALIRASIVYALMF
jgi:hypothetical protein